MEQVENTAYIETYEDFVERLTQIKESDNAMTLAFYKFCWVSKEEDEEDNTHLYKELVEEEFEKYGLKPFKINENLDLLFRFKNEAEAIVRILPRKLDILVCKL